MLTEEEIEFNRNRFLELVNSITREGVAKERLINQLTTSDFFTAPASTRFHGSYKGGLTQHCLDVYDSLIALTNAIPNCSYSSDTLIIVALFHDFSKMNFYEVEWKNKKVYSAAGKKRDEGGMFDWVSVPGYKVKEADNRFVLGSHEANALYMTESFIPLSVEEAAAILHHMGGMSNDSVPACIPEVYEKYPLAVLLHEADMLATYLLGRRSHE